MKTTINRKNHKCPNCNSTIYSKDFDKDYCPIENPKPEPVWRCECCQQKTQRQVRVSAKQKMLDELFEELK